MTHFFCKSLACLVAACLVLPSLALAEKVYSPQERRVEEARIRKDIEESLDWHNRSPEQLDGVSDKDRWLFGELNESILLRSATGERFGIFESFDDKKNVKTFEMRLHKKNRIADRFLIYSSTEGCTKGVNISAEQVNSKFAVFAVTCASEEGAYVSPMLFDYASRNLFDLSFSYDRMTNKAPHFRLQNGTYKLHWNVLLRGQETSQRIDYVFRILKDATGKWIVKDLQPSNDEEEDIGIFAVKKLPATSVYDLPAFVAGWPTY